MHITLNECLEILCCVYHLTMFIIQTCSSINLNIKNKINYLAIWNRNFEFQCIKF